MPYFLFVNCVSMKLGEKLNYFVVLINYELTWSKIEGFQGRFLGFRRNQYSVSLGNLQMLIVLILCSLLSTKLIHIKERSFFFIILIYDLLL